jgi:hypothetical protein
MQANKIWKPLLVLLISVLIGLSILITVAAPHTSFFAALPLAFVGMVIAFLWSLPVILMIAMIYRIFKGFN